jgi:hypothetical protein
MGRTLDPAASQDWHAHYRDADRRRRRAGWHRRGPSKAKRPFDPTRMLAIAMGLAAAIMLICMALPT